MPPRTLRTGQRCEIWIGGPALAQPRMLFATTDLLIEAPNWSLDGRHLVVNGAGTLWRLAVDEPEAGLTPIRFDALPELNNDHVLDPDGSHIYLSCMDRHIYRGALSGGPVERVTPEDGNWHFLHGVSPDGARLAYVEIDDLDAPGRLAVLRPGSEPERIDTGSGHVDGSEWSPDGAWIYLNTERFTHRAGHAQLARLPDGGGPVERLRASETVDWFPHLSPDGMHASFIAFAPGTLGHPENRDVEVRVVATSDWATSLQSYPLFGGQGTLNVNSWAPQGSRFAFVAYPFA